MRYKNLEDNKVNINGFTVVKEDVSLDFLIANKLIKNELSDVEEYGLEYFVFLQVYDQVKKQSMENFCTMLVDLRGVCGLRICQEEYDIFIGDEILDSVYLGVDNKIYYLVESMELYSYTQEMHTLKNECNKYPV